MEVKKTTKLGCLPLEHIQIVSRADLGNLCSARLNSTYWDSSVFIYLCISSHFIIVSPVFLFVHARIFIKYHTSSFFTKNYCNIGTFQYMNIYYLSYIYSSIYYTFILHYNKVLYKRYFVHYK